MVTGRRIKEWALPPCEGSGKKPKKRDVISEPKSFRSRHGFRGGYGGRAKCPVCRRVIGTRFDTGKIVRHMPAHKRIVTVEVVRAPTR